MNSGVMSLLDFLLYFDCFQNINPLHQHGVANILICRLICALLDNFFSVTDDCTSELQRSDCYSLCAAKIAHVGCMYISLHDTCFHGNFSGLMRTLHRKMISLSSQWQLGRKLLLNSQIFK